MSVLNIALLSALLPSVLAFPGLHGRGMGHGPYMPSGKHVLPSGFPPSGAPVGTAPFPVQNATVVGPTGTGAGGSAPVVTIQSTINLIPIPITNTVYSAGQSPESTGAAGAGGQGASPFQSGAPGASGSGAPGQSPAQSSPGSGAESPASGSAGYGAGGVGSSPTGAPGSPGSPGAGECGPATVTVTQADTVTVTFPTSLSNGAAGSGPTGPAELGSAAPSVAPSVGSGSGRSPSESSAPGAPGNGPSASPSEASGAGSPGSGPGQGPSQSSAPTFTAPFPIGNSSASVGAIGTGTGIVGTGAPTYHSPVPLPVHSQPAPVVNSLSLIQAASSVIPAPSSTAPAQVPIQSYPPIQQQSSAPGPAPSPQATSAAVLSPSSSSAPVSSSSPVSSSGGVRARGLLYGSLGAAESFETTNIGWCWDWDSSPSPATGKATGSAPGGTQFVPMLLSTESVHTSIWESNSAGAEWVMGFNEPDQCGGGGSCMSVSEVVQGWNTYFSGMSASKCSPATTNDLTTQGKGLSYMTEFLAACTGCKFEALAFHYYGSGSDTSALISTIKAYQKLQQQHGIPELWIPEMAPTDQPSSDEVTAMLAVLDNPANGVTRYAFNGLDTGSGVQLIGEVAIAYCS